MASDAEFSPHLDRLARHQGREYQGGPLCWAPEISCEGVCWVCPRNASADWRPTRICTSCRQPFKAEFPSQTAHASCGAS